jgi:hypothetical protein
MPHDAPQPDNLRASVIDRFRREAIAPDQEQRFPVRLDTTSARSR